MNDDIEEKANMARMTCADTLEQCSKCHGVPTKNNTGMCQHCLDEEKNVAMIRAGISYT